MPKITAIEKIKRQKSWYEISFDTGGSFPVNDELILKHALREGAAFEKDAVALIKSESEYAYLKYEALNRLARRRVSEKQLKDKLKSTRGYDKHIEKLIEYLREYGYLDDYSLALSLINSMTSGQPRSRRYISQKLYLRGISKNIADKALAEAIGTDTEYEAARKLAEKKFHTLKEIPTLKAKKKIGDFLRGKGFDWNEINRVVNEIFTDED